ncbi:MAG: LPS export ABC transporter periplasmic protein LptC [Pseudomonadota bacterium]
MANALENPILQAKRDAAYLLAQQHSALIGILRVAVPAMAIALSFALVLALVMLRPGAIAVVSGVQLEKLTIDNGNLVMSNPRLEGIADGDRPYIVEAERAVQAGPTADMIELEKITAEVEMDQDLTGTLKAASGTFEREANRLRLTEESVFTRSDGIEAVFQSADIEIDSGSLTSDEPVKVLQYGHQITAGSASFTENGKRLVFGDGVRVTIEPSQEADTTGATQ